VHCVTILFLLQLQFEIFDLGVPANVNTNFATYTVNVYRNRAPVLSGPNSMVINEDAHPTTVVSLTYSDPDSQVRL